MMPPVCYTEKAFSTILHLHEGEVRVACLPLYSVPHQLQQSVSLVPTKVPQQVGDDGKLKGICTQDMWTIHIYIGQHFFMQRQYALP